ncbi:ABC transporter substrate-binding protein [Micromonospora sp. ATA51]|uniref:ABC transporter substrate-binding protein n=1 Tax=Micromonospora sp. ATA51 TaxID=2806098 RepID=UPI001A3CBB57|nr:ABC transporter substrate-binding protein [Micromonospora sp. ATA51]MBM0224426.1 ABC transporter substrate-binding protein [Micromonospora sp. ATA51]
MRIIRRIRLVGLGVALAALVATAGCNSAAPSAAAGSGGTSKVTIGIGGQVLLSYLPTTLAAQLGYYKEEGLDVELLDLQAGSKALQAMIGGSTTVTSGFYEHTIQMQQKHQEIKAFVTILKLPGIVLAVSPKKASSINSVADLRGKVVGVTSPGSSTDFFLKYLLSKNGMSATDVSVTAIGAGPTAVAAMEEGKVDAAVMLDPAVSQVERRAGNLKVLYDLRTEAGVESVYATHSFPGAVLYAKSAWLEKNQETARKLSRAIARTLEWIAAHSGAEIAAKMPASYAGGDVDLYAKAIDAAKPMFSADGKMPADGPAAVLETQRVSNPEMKGADVDLSKTYTNEFVK